MRYYLIEIELYPDINFDLDVSIGYTQALLEAQLGRKHEVRIPHHSRHNRMH